VASPSPPPPPSPPHFAHQPQQAYTSYNRPEWTNRIVKAIGNWASISGSADSNVLVASDAVWIWRSTNYGANWTQVAGSDLGQWRSIACDDTGTTCVAVTFGASGAIYRSTSGGVTWSIVANTTMGFWRSLWCDPSATTCFAVIGSVSVPYQIYKSTDSGATFNAMPNTLSIQQWSVVACDATATKCIATSTKGPGYVSNDGFQTLAIVPNTYGDSYGATVSLDGTKMIIAQYDSMIGTGPDIDGPGFLWYSHDGGQTFEKSTAPRSYKFQVACDAAFKVCAVGNNMDMDFNPVPMLTSCDGGRTWSENAGDKAYWNCIKVSADGGSMFAGDDDFRSFIYSYPLPVV